MNFEEKEDRFFQLGKDYSSIISNNNLPDSLESYLLYMQCSQMFKHEALLTELLKEIKNLNTNLSKHK